MNQSIKWRNVGKERGKDLGRLVGPWIMLRNFGVFYGHWRNMRSFREKEQFTLESPMEEKKFQEELQCELLENFLGVWLPSYPGTVRIVNAKKRHFNSDGGYEDHKGQRIGRGVGQTLKDITYGIISAVPSKNANLQGQTLPDVYFCSRSQVWNEAVMPASWTTNFYPHIHLKTFKRNKTERNHYYNLTFTAA